MGLIPENDIGDPLDIEMDARTNGPVVDQNMMTRKDGLFSCGNALHVNDLVDYVSENGETAGRIAAEYSVSKKCDRKLIPLLQKKDILYVVPQFFDLNMNNKATIYFRSSKTLKKAKLRVYSQDKEYISKKYPVVRPPEMEKLTLDLNEISPDTKEILIELYGEN